MRNVRRRVVGLLTAGLIVSLLPVAERSAIAGTGRETFVSMISTAGDWVGGGTNRFYHPGNASISVSGSAAYVTVSVSGGAFGDYFDFDFAAPPGRVMVEGVYERAQRAPFREATRPGIDIGGDGRGCNTISGRFEVRQIETDGRGRVESLWVVYEQHCEEGTSALFGEVRYNVAGDGGALMLGPRYVRWPDAEQGSEPTDAPVVVVNTSDAPATAGTVTVDGPDAQSFPITANECAGEALAPGDSCIVWVDFETSRGGQNEARLVVAEGGGMAHEVPLRGWVLTGTTRFTMNSEEGDYIGQGETNEYTPDNAVIAVGGTRQYVGAGIEGEDGTWWTAEFSPPNGEILASGRTYTGARRAAFSGPAAGIDVSGTGRGCNEIYGEFTVRKIAFTDTGELEEVAIDYVQHCESPSAPALRGVLEYRLGGEPRPLAPDPSRPAPDEPTPDEVHARSVSLREGPRKLVGRVAVADGTAGCAANVVVRLQRRRDGDFRTVARVVTDDTGKFKKRVRGRRSLYRAIAPKEAGPDGSVCARAVSRKVWF
ncbi:MAG TPA: hypothetical protein VHN37_11735 [Actinomycetota bacterium]|nr:hypothetical protein [Actinomycetota bacterium]